MSGGDIAALVVTGSVSLAAIGALVYSLVVVRRSHNAETTAVRAEGVALAKLAEERVGRLLAEQRAEQAEKRSAAGALQQGAAEQEASDAASEVVDQAGDDELPLAIDDIMSIHLP